MNRMRLCANSMFVPASVAAVAIAVLPLCPASAQWSNRYPRVVGYGHHVYLEGYELPILTAGPIDPAPAPDGRHLAFAARGWIWILDLETGTAQQLTRGGDVDSRPVWHPSGDRLAIVRDNDHDTRIVVVDAVSGREMRTIDTPTLDLDPAFSPDGNTLYYTSGQAGTLDVHALELTSGDSRPVTLDPGLEMKPQPFRDGRMLILAKRGGDRVELRPPDGGEGRVLASGDIASMARPALSPGEDLIALNWPANNGWELRIVNVDQPGAPVVLTRGGLPLTPAWSHDGQWVYYSEADQRESMRLMRVRQAGGTPEEVAVHAWEWAGETGRLRIRTTLAESQREAGEPGAGHDVRPAPARLNAIDENGHPLVPDQGAPHFDGATGRVFFYSPGVVEIVAPAGAVTVSAVQGLATPEVTRTIEVPGGAMAETTLALEPIWDARAAGWTSGDHHFHLNYGGQTNLDPEDMVIRMQGEALDMATPLLANLHNRYEDQDLWGWESAQSPPFIRFGQEIRSHFLGHMGLIEIPTLHWPWVWGPGYEVYGDDDRTNASVLDFAHAQGGLGYYVHPVSTPDPFLLGGGGVPVELVADAVMGDVDALEIICLWSSSQGTSALWHRFLNIGVAVAPSAGTDVMLNLYRTMAVGATRVYVHTGEQVNWPRYIDGLRAGRSFVTNGPILDLRVNGARPGEVVAGGSAAWTLDLATATEVDTVEIIVNGRVAATRSGMETPGRKTLGGELELPSGGWIAARARGGETRWPAMDTAPFAHTAPVWIGARGSTDPATRREAAAELQEVLAASLARLRSGYEGTPIPRLEARFAEAMARLEALAAEGS